MIDLKKIITQLDAETYNGLEKAFLKTKADNSLYLLKIYRNSCPKDEEIIGSLNINPTSLYTLKSRLYDKIQNQLSKAETLTEEELLNQVNQIHQVCYNNSKEISVAMLTKLEENLLKNDMHGELLIVYSALKQLHLFTEKYYYYSQLYNKQIAFNLTTEKAIEILGNFNRLLMQYDFSKSQTDLETLNFLYKGVLEQYSLNSSKQIELIKNIIECELILFTPSELIPGLTPVPDLINRAEMLIEQLPYYKEQKQWLPIINYLSFEFYRSKNDYKNAEQYFNKVNTDLGILPFYSNVSVISKFLISKIGYTSEHSKDGFTNLKRFDLEYIDNKNIHSTIIVELYNSMVLYFDGKLKEAIATLNNLLNDISLKDLNYISINIKLTLAYLYIKKKEFDMAETILKSVSRKIKADCPEQFSLVNNLIKLFQLEINQGGKNVKSQQSDLLTLFLSKNKELRLMEHLNHEFIKQYAL